VDENIRREIIMEHYREPLNRHRTEEKEYQYINTNNSSCIDNLDLFVKIEENKLKDICFDGEACAISTSSTSIMIKNLIGKTIEEAQDYIENFEKMLNEEEYNEELLQEAIAYKEIYKQGNRKHCAFLPYEGIKKILNKNNN